MAMSYEEKNAWAFGVIAVLGYAVYLALVLPSAATTPIPETPYVVPMIGTIAGGIAAGILAGIVLGIATPRGARADVRDRDIARMGERVGSAFLVIGALGALVLAWVEAHPFWIANVLYLGFVLSAVLGVIARLVAYRRGMPTW
jgi:hypothetical protein